MIASAFFSEYHSFALRCLLVGDHSIALHQAGREHPLVARLFSAPA